MKTRKKLMIKFKEEFLISQQWREVLQQKLSHCYLGATKLLGAVLNNM